MACTSPSSSAFAHMRYKGDAAWLALASASPPPAGRRASATPSTASGPALAPRRSHDKARLARRGSRPRTLQLPCVRPRPRCCASHNRSSAPTSGSPTTIRPPLLLNETHAASASCSLPSPLLALLFVQESAGWWYSCPQPAALPQRPSLCLAAAVSLPSARACSEAVMATGRPDVELRL